MTSDDKFRIKESVGGVLRRVKKDKNGNEIEVEKIEIPQQPQQDL